MKAFFCNVGIQDTIQEYIDGYARCESTFVCDVVFAPTRGKAKALFAAAADRRVRYGVEFMDVRARQIRTDVVREIGLAKWDDELWNYVDYSF